MAHLLRCFRSAALLALFALARLLRAQKDSNAALFAAIDHEDLAALQGALLAGASLHAQDLYGHTPLVAAAAQGNARLVRNLLEAGADAGVRDKYGKTAADYAAQNHHDNVAAVLLEALQRTPVPAH